MLEGEQELITQAQAGDARCFAKLYDHYIPKIYRFVFVKVNHREEAEDLTHEVFLSAWQKLGGYVHQGFPFSSWLYQIARHKVIDHYRLRKNHVRLDDVESDSLKLESTLEAALDRSMDWRRVAALLTQLTDDQQDVLVLRFVEELSYEEIASALGKSEGAVRLIQHRAIQALRKLTAANQKEHYA